MGEQGHIYFYERLGFVFIIPAEDISLFSFVQHLEMTTATILPGLLQVWGVHKLHEAEMQGVVQTVLEEIRPS